MEHSEIISHLPYAHPFLFVDELVEINENSVTGSYTFPEDAFFYKGHFKDAPVTPGVILTECMAQIGVVCLGISFYSGKDLENLKIGMSSTNMDFYHPVYPGEKVVVTSEKIYFRFNKLKCMVKMYNSQQKLVCKGEISGMIMSNE
jgi:3-hydroxyacyl-[acyl-carrier-protein] dehydratase